MPFDVLSYVLAKRALRRALSHANRHAVGGADEIPDNALTRAKIKDLLPITRADLEYPTEDVSLAYLLAIDKAKQARHEGVGVYHGVFTVDSLADKAVKKYMRDYGQIVMRASAFDDADFYMASLHSPSSTADFKLQKRIAGSYTNLASESVDINQYYVYLVAGQCVGSTLKGFREDLTTAKISATDTDLASGKYGAAQTYTYTQVVVMAELIAPLSPSPPTKTIIEAELTGSGTLEDPYRPALAQQLDSHPVYGNIDKLAVTWGAFDHKHEHPTMLIMITGDNPYQAGAIDKQKEHASKKGLKVLSPPRDYFEAIEQYRKLKADYPHWLAGKDNYVYQALGHEALELFQVADFYYGELLEHKTHYQQLKRVPDWEMDRTLNRWRDRLQRVDVLHEERDKHVKKLTEVLKKGW